MKKKRILMLACLLTLVSVLVFPTESQCAVNFSHCRLLDDERQVWKDAFYYMRVQLGTQDKTSGTTSDPECLYADRTTQIFMAEKYGYTKDIDGDGVNDTYDDGSYYVNKEMKIYNDGVILDMNGEREGIHFHREMMAIFVSAEEAAAASTTSAATSSAAYTAETVTESEAEGSFVVVSEEAEVYTDYNSSDVLGTLALEETVDIVGKTSNSMYKIVYNEDYGYIKESNVVSYDAYASGDAWELVSMTEPTCTESGDALYQSVYNNSITRTEILDPLGHDFEETVTVEPTCTESGVLTKTCQRCGCIETVSIEALGHEAGEWVVTKEATFFTNGEQVQYCERCGEVVATEVIPRTGPLPLWAAIAIGVIGVGGCGAAIFLWKKKAA